MEERLRDLSLRLTEIADSERRRIATGLHDRVTQTLALAKIRLDVMQREQSLRPDLTARVNEIRELCGESLRAVRTLVFELNSPCLHDVELAAALTRLARHHEQLHGFRVELCGGLKARLDGDTQTVLLRAVGELLCNVAKHARAQRVVVRTELTRHGVRLSIEDDGIGFVPTARVRQPSPHGGFGLSSIAEQLALRGGHLRLDSRPGCGTRVELLIPRCRERDHASQDRPRRRPSSRARRPARPARARGSGSRRRGR